MIEGMFNSGSMPALERLVQFTGERHKVLTDSIANISTPNHRPRDLEPAEFQAALRDAVERRRGSDRPMKGELEMRDTRHMSFEPDRIDADPGPADRNILFHDRNNRSLEHLMQGLAENQLMHDAGITMLRNEFEMLKMAIRERV